MVGSKKNNILVKKNLVPKKYLSEKFLGLEKNFMVEIFLGPNNFLGAKKIFGPNNFWVQKRFWVPNNFWVQKICFEPKYIWGLKKTFGSRKAQKLLGSGRHKKILWLEKILVPDYFFGKKIFFWSTFHNRSRSSPILHSQVSK